MSGAGLLFRCLLFPVEKVKFLTRLEPNGFSGCDADLGTGSRIAADARFSRLDHKNSKATELDSVTGDKTLLHGVEDCVNGGLRLRLGQACTVDNPLNEVLLDQVDGLSALLLRNTSASNTDSCDLRNTPEECQRTSLTIAVATT